MDLPLRFHKDLLVVSGCLDAACAKYGMDVERDREFTYLFEPDTVQEVMKMEMLMGAQCLATNTPGITQARLAHSRMEDNSADICTNALQVVRELQPQHMLAEIGPTLLPIDSESKASLKQNRDQYVKAAQDFLAAGDFDAFFLNGMAGIVDLKCALMGLRMVSDRPIIASVEAASDGTLVGRKKETLLEAVAVMEEYQADVVGFSTMAPVDVTVSMVKEVAAATDLPIMVELQVGEHTEKEVNPSFVPVKITDDNPYKTPDAVMDAALALIPAGVQFLRVAGQNSPSYTGALMVACSTSTCAR